MTQSQLREHVSKMYPGPKWRARVAKMTHLQLINIYKIKQEISHGQARRGERALPQE